MEDRFRETFEDFRVQPSPGLWKSIARDLRYKNFLRFDPARVNIYYAAMVSGALIVAALIVLPGNNEQPAQTSNTLPAPPQAQEMPPASTPDAVSDTAPLELPPAAGTQPEVQTGKKTKPSGKQTPAPAPLPGNAGKKDEPGTTTADTLIIQPLQSPPLAFFTASESAGCVPLNVQFRNLSANAGHYHWSFGDGGMSEQEHPGYIFDEPGQFIVTLTAGKGQQLRTHSLTVTVHPRPVARFEFDPRELPENGQPVYFYNKSSGAVSYEWDFGDGTGSEEKDPVWFYNPEGSGNLRLKAFSAEGCTDSSRLTGAFTEKEPVLRFPTAFRPNTGGPVGGYYNPREGNNSVFHPYMEEAPVEYQLRIFNRAGILVFESNDYQQGWDGYYRQQLQPAGVYVWKVRARFENGKTLVKMGDVTMVWTRW
jgi:PKD repeat protein